MNYVVIGSSAAGVNAVRTLRKLEPEAKITLISKDKDIYSRCILHEYLSGERDLARLNFAEADFETKYDVDWLRGREAIRLKPEEHTVIVDNGEEIPYDKLLIATGSHTFFPPIPGLAGVKNMVGFRNIDDMEPIKKAAETCENIIIMGAGLVGIDCATGLVELGKKATLVDFAPWMLSKQLDEKAATAYQNIYAEKGIDQYYGVGMQEVLQDEDGNITACILTDGTKLPCDYLIMTAGVRANVEFLEGSGLETSRFGLVFDDTGRTSDPDIYGAGDVSGLSPIWPAAVKEGIIAAYNMAGKRREKTDFFASKSTMNFMGLPTLSIGNVNPTEEELEDLTVSIQEKPDSYKKILHKDGKITGALLQGDISYAGVLLQLIARKIDISKVKKTIFDIDYSDFFHMKKNFEYYYDLPGDKQERSI